MSDMKLTVKSLSDSQMSMLQKTNDVETSLTKLYMSVLVSLVKSHGVAELIGRERLSLSGKAVDVIFKAKVSLGYPNTDKAREAVRTMCSPIWSGRIAPCIEETEDGYLYDADKLDENKSEVESGNWTIHKAKKKKKGQSGGNGGGQSIEDRMAEFFKYVDKLGSEAKRKAVLKQMEKEIAKRK
jgi:hypothetical protein